MELEQRKDYLNSKSLSTIYFGGGTPSLLSKVQFEQIFETIDRFFEVSKAVEITLEANPNDLTNQYLSDLKGLGFNRLSIGIQSFDDADLKIINRRHTSHEAIEAVKTAQAAGFENISIDLIFALPLQTLSAWKCNLEQAFALQVQHISSYNLMFERGTDFYRQREKGLIKETNEELSLAMYQALIEQSRSHGFVHYETSNFALEGFYSKHNSNYWLGTSYLGLGAGAHSYNGNSRRWNVSNNKQYIEGIRSQRPVFEIEMLNKQAAYNDFVMIGLRTIWGCDLLLMKERFGKAMVDYCLSNAKPYLANHQLELKKNKLTIVPSALFISDQIMSDLMYIED